MLQIIYLPDKKKEAEGANLPVRKAPLWPRREEGVGGRDKAARASPPPSISAAFVSTIGAGPSKLVEIFCSTRRLDCLRMVRNFYS